MWEITLKVIQKRKHTNVQQSADTIIHALAQLKTIILDLTEILQSYSKIEIYKYIKFKY